MPKSIDHFRPWKPLATNEKPMVAPTMECVPEMGKRNDVAINSHVALPPVEYHNLIQYNHNCTSATILLNK